MSARPPAALRGSRPGFTLVELLVSMSVLVLMLVMVVQMVNATLAVTTSGSRHLDADTQARLVLDRMAVDFTQMVKRTDVDYYFQKNSGTGNGGANDQMAFYSETSGYYPAGITDATLKSNGSLVGYRINSNRQLERLDKALVWSGAKSGTVRGMTFLPQTLASTWTGITGSTVGSDTDYHVIGEQIFRLEYCFLLRNASTDAKFSDAPYFGPTSFPLPSPLPCNAMRDVSAVVVTLAALDDTSRLIVTSSSLDKAAALLEDSGSGGGSLDATPPAKRWLAHIADKTLVQAGMPVSAAANVRVYERCFYLGNAQ